MAVLGNLEEDKDEDSLQVGTMPSPPKRDAREKELLEAYGQMGDAKEVLNERAVAVMKRMSDKLTGRDFLQEVYTESNMHPIRGCSFLRCCMLKAVALSAIGFVSASVAKKVLCEAAGDSSLNCFMHIKSRDSSAVGILKICFWSLHTFVLVLP